MGFLSNRITKSESEILSLGKEGREIVGRLVEVTYLGVVEKLGGAEISLSGIEGEKTQHYSTFLSWDKVEFTKLVSIDERSLPPYLQKYKEVMEGYLFPSVALKFQVDLYWADEDEIQPHHGELFIKHGKVKGFTLSFVGKPEIVSVDIYITFQVQPLTENSPLYSLSSEEIVRSSLLRYLKDTRSSLSQALVRVLTEEFSHWLLLVIRFVSETPYMESEEREMSPSEIEVKILQFVFEYKNMKVGELLDEIIGHWLRGERNMDLEKLFVQLWGSWLWENKFAETYEEGIKLASRWWDIYSTYTLGEGKLRKEFLDTSFFDVPPGAIRENIKYLKGFFSERLPQILFTSEIVNWDRRQLLDFVGSHLLLALKSLEMLKVSTDVEVGRSYHKLVENLTEAFTKFYNTLDDYLKTMDKDTKTKITDLITEIVGLLEELEKVCDEIFPSFPLMEYLLLLKELSEGEGGLSPTGGVKSLGTEKWVEIVKETVKGGTLERVSYHSKDTNGKVFYDYIEFSRNWVVGDDKFRVVVVAYNVEVTNGDDDYVRESVFANGYYDHADNTIGIEINASEDDWWSEDAKVTVTLPLDNPTDLNLLRHIVLLLLEGTDNLKSVVVEEFLHYIRGLPPTVHRFHIVRPEEIEAKTQKLGYLREDYKEVIRGLETAPSLEKVNRLVKVISDFVMEENSREIEEIAEIITSEYGDELVSDEDGEFVYDDEVAEAVACVWVKNFLEGKGLDDLLSRWMDTLDERTKKLMEILEEHSTRPFIF